MAKAKVSKKRRRRHLKKNVRWTIAGLMMATAIVIALIPVQGGGVSAITATDTPDEYSLDVLMNDSHKYVADYSYDGTEPAYKVYLVKGKMSGDTYNTDPTEIIEGVDEHEYTGKVSISQSKDIISKDGGSKWDDYTSVDKSKTYYYLVNNAGNSITTSEEAREEYAIDTGKQNVLARYIGDGETLVLNAYDDVHPDDIGLGYCEIQSTVDKNSKKCFMAIATETKSAEATYDIVYKTEVDPETGETITTDEIDEEETEIKRRAAISDAKASLETAETSKESIVYVCDKLPKITDISKQAFNKADVTKIASFDLSNSIIKNIGDGAFANVNAIDSSLKLPNTIEKIGTAAFYNSNFSDYSVNEFANDISMGCGVFSKCTDISSDKEIKLDKVKTIINHDPTSADGKRYSCGIFAGSSAKKIYLPDMTCDLPKGTVSNISGLEYVRLGQGNAGILDNTSNEDNEFIKVDNDYFYVWGPEDTEGSLTKSHTFCRDNNIPYRYDDGTENYMLLNYEDEQGYIYDVKVDFDNYTTSIININKTGTSTELRIPDTIAGYRINKIGDGAAKDSKVMGISTLVIPVTIDDIGDNAFSGITTLHEVYFTYVATEDKKEITGVGTSIIRTFYSPDNDIKIGKECFKDDNALTFVDFRTDDYEHGKMYEANVTEIGADAFKTYTNVVEGGVEQGLTFRGKLPKVEINEEDGSSSYEIYEPYELCTDVSRCKYGSTGTGIKYDTGAPENVKFGYDTTIGAVTLYKYPDKDTKVTIGITTGEGDAKTVIVEDKNVLYCVQEWYKAELDETHQYIIPDVVRQAAESYRDIIIPQGITSIDAAYADGDVTKGKFFRNLKGIDPAVINTALAEMNASLPSDTKPIGTKSIVLTDVEVLPEGAFASTNANASEPAFPVNETSTLEKVTFLGDVKNICKPTTMNAKTFNLTPFESSTNVNDVRFLGENEEKDNTDNPRYEYMNGIIYSYGAEPTITQTGQAGDNIPYKEIVECLPIRGSNNPGGTIGGRGVINDSYDTSLVDVTRIGPKAFEECNLITEVDLTAATKFEEIGNSAFYHCDKLTSVKLPEYKPQHISSKAFGKCDAGLTLSILNTQCSVETDAFEGTSKDNPVHVLGYKVPSGLMDRINYLSKTEPCYFGELPKFSTVTFVRINPKNKEDKVVLPYELGTQTDIPLLGSAKDPKLDSDYFKNYIEIYRDEGFEFVGWDKALDNITEDTEIKANYNNIELPKYNKVRFLYRDPANEEDIEKEVFPEKYTQDIETGKSAIYPDPSDDLIKRLLDIYPDYEFVGWTPDVSYCDEVTGPIDFHARYKEKKDPSTDHKATFIDYDWSTVLFTETVADNTAPLGPPASKIPTREGYTFAGWKPDLLTPITEDTKYYAQYVANDKPTPVPPTSSDPTSSSPTSSSPSSSTPSTSSGSSSDKTSSSNKSSSSSSTNKSSSSSSSSSMKPVVISGAPTPVVQPGTGASAAPGSSTAGKVTSSSSNVKTGNTNVVSTAPGLTNNGKMSATVNGSSDNYVVKITQTSEAENSAKEALSKNFGSLDNIKYMPFDISLYDSTGNKKIENVPAGVTVSVTMPIPDDLAVYGGNNKVASTTGGVLEPLQPRFTVIDGVPCMNYTVSHFSPYVVYVDTANLTATGTLDSTPKTADPIHPKWFLCIGLAALSIMLFLKRDKESLRAA